MIHYSSYYQAWEDRLIDPNWIENKDWNIVTEMIYDSNRSF